MARRTYDFSLGIFVLAALSVLAYMILRFGGFATAKARYDLVIRFESVQGLSEGNPVYYAGVECGIVKKIDAMTDLEGKVLVTVSIDERIQIRQDDTPQVISINILAEKVVNFVPGNRKAVVVPRGSLFPKDGQTLDPMEQLMKALGELASPEALQDIRGVLKNLRALTGEDIQQSLRNTMTRLEEASTKLSMSMDSFGRLVSDENVENVAQVLRNARQASAEWPVLAREVTGLFAETRERVGEVLAAVTRGEGTLGRLVYDRRLYDEATDLVRVIKQYGLFWHRGVRSEIEQAREAQAREGLIWKQ